jgi:threonine/homoserine/homoserine lactone efflux protein
VSISHRPATQVSEQSIEHQFYLTVAIAARRILSARPHASQIVARLSGVVIIAVAITLTFERALAA